jgi:hypothetical protein
VDGAVEGVASAHGPLRNDLTLGLAAEPPHSTPALGLAEPHLRLVGWGAFAVVRASEWEARLYWLALKSESAREARSKPAEPPGDARRGAPVRAFTV